MQTIAELIEDSVDAGTAVVSPCTNSETVASSVSGADLELIGDFREQQLFQSLDVDNDQHARRRDLENVLLENGLDVNDIRFAESLRLLRRCLKRVA
ncbi:hypothetical protein C2W62_34585 [Candidatus Entotheonella serta]|nr:hypothetical protein C2W62_34585 [Candidatus Entotheonella serta]